MIHKFTLSLNSALSWSFKILMFALTVEFFFQGEISLGLFSAAALLVSLVPALVNHSYDTNLPWSFDFWLTLWMAFSILGSAGLYQEIPWWDSLLHFAGTAIGAYLAFMVVYALNFTGKVRLSIPLIGFFTLMMALAFGALWEMSEFWTWQVTGQDVLGGRNDPAYSLLDTFYDLHLDLAGAALAALGGMIYVARQRHVYLRQRLLPLIEVFDEKLRFARRRAVARKNKLKQRLTTRKNLLKRKLKKKLARAKNFKV
jgi:uncharacterized membrane protein YjdF